MRNIGLIELVLIAAVVFVVYCAMVILLRRARCWYWKINRIVALLESIDKKLDGAEVSSEIETQ